MLDRLYDMGILGELISMGWIKRPIRTLSRLVFVDVGTKMFKDVSYLVDNEARQ